MLKDKAAIVTGRTKGIGGAIALELTDHGTNIIVDYRSSDKETEELRTILEEKEVKVLTVKCDISNFEDSKNLMDKYKEVFGKMDILINNTGITKDALIMRMKEEDFNNVIDVNLRGTFDCTKRVSAIMLRQRFGKITNMISTVGIAGSAGQVNYATSKAGVIGLAKSLTKELGSGGITMSAVAPGSVDTDMTASLSEKVREEASKNILLERLGDPEDVANLVGFLASDTANYIISQVIDVDGEMVM